MAIKNDARLNGFLNKSDLIQNDSLVVSGSSVTNALDSLKSSINSTSAGLNRKPAVDNFVTYVLKTGADSADLPSSGVSAGDTAFIVDTETLYTYDGSSWDAGTVVTYTRIATNDTVEAAGTVNGEDADIWYKDGTWQTEGCAEGNITFIKIDTGSYANKDAVLIVNGTSHYWEIRPTVITNHNDMQNIQGGISGEEYHLTQSQHDTLTDGSNADSLHIHAASAVTSTAIPSTSGIPANVQAQLDALRALSLGEISSAINVRIVDSTYDSSSYEDADYIFTSVGDYNSWISANPASKVVVHIETNDTTAIEVYPNTVIDGGFRTISVALQDNTGSVHYVSNADVTAVSAAAASGMHVLVTTNSSFTGTSFTNGSYITIYALRCSASASTNFSTLSNIVFVAGLLDTVTLGACSLHNSMTSGVIFNGAGNGNFNAFNSELHNLSMTGSLSDDRGIYLTNSDAYFDNATNPVDNGVTLNGHTVIFRAEVSYISFADNSSSVFSNVSDIRLRGVASLNNTLYSTIFPNATMRDIDGSFYNGTGTNYTTSSRTDQEAIKALDTEIKTLADSSSPTANKTMFLKAFTTTSAWADSSNLQNVSLDLDFDDESIANGVVNLKAMISVEVSSSQWYSFKAEFAGYWNGTSVTIDDSSEVVTTIAEAGTTGVSISFDESGDTVQTTLSNVTGASIASGAKIVIRYEIISSGMTATYWGMG